MFFCFGRNTRHPETIALLAHRLALALLHKRHGSAVRLNSLAPNVYPPVNIRNLSTGESGEKRAEEVKLGRNRSTA